jgi:hypothetical protein
VPAPDDATDDATNDATDGATDGATDDATFRLLHEIRLRGILVSENIVDLEASETVTVLIGQGFVVQSARGVRITTAGREMHTSWARLPAGEEPEQLARRAYERFLPLNHELLRVCSDWQVHPGGVPNDHRDARYDWSVLDRAHTLDERIAPIVSRLGRTVARFSGYRPRLRAALERVDDGEIDWLTSPRCDSYHTVWMQMHEDLLLAIGGDRADEPRVDGH